MVLIVGAGAGIAALLSWAAAKVPSGIPRGRRLMIMGSLQVVFALVLGFAQPEPATTAADPRSCDEPYSCLGPGPGAFNGLSDFFAMIVRVLFSFGFGAAGAGAVVRGLKLENR